jgi:accessory colonization factor AcfC
MIAFGVHSFLSAIRAIPDIDAGSARALYLHRPAILVRPGNPAHISGFQDLLKPGHRILVVNGAGQQRLWQDVAGRLGKIDSMRAFRANIASFAANSGRHGSATSPPTPG